MTDSLLIRVTSTLQQRAAQAIVAMIAEEEAAHGVGHVNGRFYVIVCRRQITSGKDEVVHTETLPPVDEQWVVDIEAAKP